MSLTLSDSGTTTPVVNTPSTLLTDTNNGVFEFSIDTTNMVLGDLLLVQINTICLSGGSQLLVWEAFYQHSQLCPLKKSPWVGSDQSIQVVINQTAGTARAFAWKMLRA
jgi:hypothetical protein